MENNESSKSRKRIPTYSMSIKVTLYDKKIYTWVDSMGNKSKFVGGLFEEEYKKRLKNDSNDS